MKKIANVAANSYTVDFTARKIIASASFMERAGQYGSEEYNTIMALRKDLPDFTLVTVEEKKESKKQKPFTIDIMEAYLIRTYEEESNEVKEFRKVAEESKVRGSGCYAYMKKWFHAAYPDGYKLLRALSDGSEEKKQSKEKAAKHVETVFMMQDAVSKGQVAEAQKTSADHSDSAEEQKKVVNFNG